MTQSRWIGAAVVLALAAALAFFVFYDPGLPDDAADGVYANDCCGTIELRDGRFVLNGKQQRVGYVLEQDEAGPYVLPTTFVGTWEERGFEIDGSRPALKLRLDRLPNPHTIQLSAPRGFHTFTRKTRG